MQEAGEQAATGIGQTAMAACGARSERGGGAVAEADGRAEIDELDDSGTLPLNASSQARLRLAAAEWR